MSNTEKKNIELERLEYIAKQYYGGLPNLARAMGIDRTTFYSYKKYSGIGDKMLDSLKIKLKINPDYIRNGSEPIFLAGIYTTGIRNNNDKAQTDTIIIKRNEVFDRLENIAIKYFRSLSNMAQLAGKNRAILFRYKNVDSIGKKMLYTLKEKLNINPEYLLRGTEPIFIDDQPPDCVFKKFDKKNPPVILSNVRAISPISSSVRAIPILDANKPTQTNDIINNPEILFDNNIRNKRLMDLIQRRERVGADIESLTILRERLDNEIALLRRAELELSKK